MSGKRARAIRKAIHGAPGNRGRTDASLTLLYRRAKRAYTVGRSNKGNR